MPDQPQRDEGSDIKTSTEEKMPNQPQQDERADIKTSTEEKMPNQPQQDERADIKIFNDSVHGTIRLDPLLVKIIDTPEFQRLRNIKQLGACYRVYPAASHNRFEHSIGVCHLAGLFIEKLMSKQPRLNITKEEILCVKIAGLCHDLGHGPFSHFFDTEFKEKVGGKWKHEDISVNMLRQLYERKKSEFQASNLEKSHLDLICDIINPPEIMDEETNPRAPTSTANCSHRTEKQFLFEIVSSANGLDVDRWDYFARDCLHLGLRYSFDHLRCMEMARVINGRICYRDKEKVNIYNMFYTRYNLYQCAYLHRKHCAIQVMMAEAFELAKDTLTFEGAIGSIKSLDKIVEDMTAYSKATDDIYYTILNWTEPKQEKTERMKKAQELLKMIEERDVYQVIECKANSNKFLANSNIAEECKSLQEQVQDWLRGKKHTEQDVVIRVIQIGFGGKKQFPLEGVLFFEKAENPQKYCVIKKEELPEPIKSMSTIDIRIRVYFKHSSEKEKLTDEQLKTYRAELETKFGIPNVGSVAGALTEAGAGPSASTPGAAAAANPPEV